MKTKWIQTKTGLYMQIIEADFEGLHVVDPPTEEEMINASFRYMAKHYGQSIDELASEMIRTGETLTQLGETLAILNDPETMEAIREGFDDEPTRSV